MKPRKVKDMQAVLARKGFRQDDTHHKCFWFYCNNRKSSINTHFSHGSKEYGVELLTLVRRQIKLKSKEFERFFDCTMSGSDYQKLMVDRDCVNEPVARTSNRRRRLG